MPMAPGEGYETGLKAPLGVPRSSPSLLGIPESIKEGLGPHWGQNLLDKGNPEEKGIGHARAGNV